MPKPELSLSFNVETIGNGYIVGMNAAQTRGDPMGQRFPRQFCVDATDIGESVQILVQQEIDAIEREERLGR